VGTSFHRYYFQLFVQTPGRSPSADFFFENSLNNLTAIQLFNFPVWANYSGLSQVPHHRLAIFTRVSFTQPHKQRDSSGFFVLLQLAVSMMIVQNPNGTFSGNSVPTDIWDGSCNIAVSVQYPGAPPVTCLTTVSLSATAAAPTVRVPTALTGSLYTVFMVDRDSTSAATPSFSPLRLWALTNVPGAELKVGLNPSSTQATVLTKYSQPPVCEQFYPLIAVLFSAHFLFCFSLFSRRRSRCGIATTSSSTSRLLASLRRRIRSSRHPRSTLPFSGTSRPGPPPTISHWYTLTCLIGSFH
jgi:hypothetical protein